jgi:hypothetical protein
MIVKLIVAPLVKRLFAFGDNKTFTAVFTGAQFPGAKRLEYEADHSPSAQVK